MTGPLSWRSILEYVSSYSPLDSSDNFYSADFASTGFVMSALLSGHSTAEYGYLGYLVLLIRRQGIRGIRTSVTYANVQKGFEALLRFLWVYMAKFRMGLVRMTAYTYGTFIAGSLLLWACPPKRISRRSFLLAQLSTLTVGYAGQRSTSYFFEAEIKKAKKKFPCPGPPPPPPPCQSPVRCCRGRCKGTMAQPGYTCYCSGEPLAGCMAPAATVRESCVCLFFGEQYNWRPHVCPILKDGAGEGLRTCCYQEFNCTEKGFSCTEKDNGGNSSVIEKQTQVEKGPQDTQEEVNCVSKQQQQQNAREMRNRIRKKLFAAKLPGAIFGTVLSVFSSADFIMLSTLIAGVSYHLFFWLGGAGCYDLEEMEIDTIDENESGEMEEYDKKGKKKIPADAFVPELKEAVKVLLKLKLLLLWLTFATTFYLVNATADSLFMEQVDYLQKNTECQSSKNLDSLFYSFKNLVSSITEEVCRCLIENYVKKKNERWARLLRISIGMVFSSFCCLVASLVAFRLYCHYNSASMLWLLPQFLLLGMMKGILEEGLREFLRDHIANDSRVGAVLEIADSVGNFLSGILTNASPSSWVGSGNDISESHLDYYYRMLAFITLSSTFLFTIVATAYELRKGKDNKDS